MSSIRDRVLEHVRSELNKEAKASIGKKLKRLAIGTTLLAGTGAAATGAAKAVGTNTKTTSNYAPPQQVPPGY